LEINVDGAPTTDNGIRAARRSEGVQHSEASQQASHFDLKRVFPKVRVVRGFHDDVVVTIRKRGVGRGACSDSRAAAVIKLGEVRCRGKNYLCGRELLRILQGHSDGPFLSGVIGQAELRLARPREAHLKVRVLSKRKKKV
jgi:hypothetical protein